MWLLIFIGIWTAESVPINQTQEATTSVQDGGILNNLQNVRSPAAVGGVYSNVTQDNATSAPGSVLVSFTPPGMTYPETLPELTDGLVADEGDILFLEDRNAVRMVWLDAVVPYVTDESVAHRNSEIQAAFEMISVSTCIRFVPHSTEFNYLKFVEGTGCASFVGCQGGEQPLYFSKVCNVGNLCHEILHALGLHHEHTRQDRDQYVSVEWGNILKGKEKNFDVKTGDLLDLPYDLKSIMHYGEFFFSKDGSRTLLPKKSDKDVGQRKQLSSLDVQKLNKLYHCGE